MLPLDVRTVCAILLIVSVALHLVTVFMWVGWLSIAYGLGGLGLTGITGGNVPPFLQHLMPILLGILLLLPPVVASGSGS